MGSLPFFHVFGMTIAMNWPILNGWEIILIPKPEPDALLTAVKKFKPTIATLIPHPKRGEQVKLFVVLKEGVAAEPEEFIEFCSDKHAKYKLPTQVEIRDALPKTNIGKILRKDLRQEEMTGNR